MVFGAFEDVEGDAEGFAVFVDGVEEVEENLDHLVSADLVQFGVTGAGLTCNHL